MSGAEHTVDPDQSDHRPVGRTAAAYLAAKWLLGLGLFGATLTLVDTAMQASNLIELFGPRGSDTTSVPLTMIWVSGFTHALLIAAAGLLAYHVVNLLAQIADNTRS